MIGFRLLHHAFEEVFKLSVVMQELHLRECRLEVVRSVSRRGLGHGDLLAGELRGELHIVS